MLNNKIDADEVFFFTVVLSFWYQHAQKAYHESQCLGDRLSFHFCLKRKCK